MNKASDQALADTKYEVVDSLIAGTLTWGKLHVHDISWLVGKAATVVIGNAEIA
jgi:hypothetical protein